MPAKWKYGFLCDAAMQVYGKWTYQGVFGEISAQAFPAIHPQAALAFRFNAAVGPHTLRIQLTDSQGKLVVPELRLLVECQEFKDNEVVAQIRPIPLPAQGFYSFRMFLDDDKEPFGNIEFQALLIGKQPQRLGGA